MEIYATIHPFVIKQNFYIVDKNECIKTFTCNLENMGKKMYQICEQKDINKIHFHGGQLYALKLKDEFIAHKFGNKHIEIIID